MKKLQKRREKMPAGQRRQYLTAGAVVLGLAVALALAVFGGQMLGPQFAGLGAGVLLVGGSMAFLVFLFFIAIRAQRVNFH